MKFNTRNEIDLFRADSASAASLLGQNRAEKSPTPAHRVENPSIVGRIESDDAEHMIDEKGRGVILAKRMADFSRKEIEIERPQRRRQHRCIKRDRECLGCHILQQLNRMLIGHVDRRLEDVAVHQIGDASIAKEFPGLDRAPRSRRRRQGRLRLRVSPRGVSA